jgi:HAD superfamily hydrolase (TIGR01549 family)
MASLDAPVKAAIFDIGATLITGPPVAPNKVIAGLISGATAAEVAAVIMTTPFECADDVCRALAATFGAIDDQARDSIAELWSAQASAPREIDGASETVLALNGRGIRIGLLSDIWSPYYAGVVNALPQVIEAADAIVLSFRTGARKPHPDNFLRALSELQVEPSEAVMVGDTYEHDILPALELGMRAVWVLARPEREHEAIIKVLNGKLPAPTATVLDITEVASLWTPCALRGAT